MAAKCVLVSKQQNLQANGKNSQSKIRTIRREKSVGDGAVQGSAHPPGFGFYANTPETGKENSCAEVISVRLRYPYVKWVFVVG